MYPGASIVLYPITIQEIANKVRRAVGTKYKLEYYDRCTYNCPAGCGALYVCELYIVDKYEDKAVAKIEWTERVDCVCFETWCDPTERKLSSELVIEDMGLPQDKKDKLEKVIEKVNARFKQSPR
jgi:hypothetical protein